jgi:hypothetical protein
VTCGNAIDKSPSKILGHGGDPPIDILRIVNEQETVDRLAILAKPRLTSLLRLRGVTHVYDQT